MHSLFLKVGCVLWSGKRVNLGFRIGIGLLRVQCENVDLVFKSKQKTRLNSVYI